MPGQRVQAEGFRRGPGRLARVGYLSRFADALFAGSLLLRGRVPGGIARSSALWYRTTAHDGPHPYYGRVFRDAGWTVLQYWFFYAFNDWRSAFHGANDHEADWEQITLFLSSEDEGEAIPRWAAYAQHDYHGEALRRRWDDAEQLQVIDGHPVVFAGAGSHASYFVPGEYQAEQELRLPRWMHVIADTIGRLLGNGSDDDDADRQRLLPIAFVDYARGDGVSIGPGQERVWSPVLLDETSAMGIRVQRAVGRLHPGSLRGRGCPGRPGLQSRRIGPWLMVRPARLFRASTASRRPSTRRRSWRVALSRWSSSRKPCRPRSRTSGGSSWRAGPSWRRSGTTPTCSTRPRRRGSRIEELRARNRKQRLALTESYARAEAIERRRGRVAAGIMDAPRAHATRIATPAPTGSIAYGRVLELWAALSIGLLLIGLVVALLVAPAYGVIAAILLIGAFIFIESVLRGTVVALVTTISVALALIASVILAIHFWVPLLIAERRWSPASS